MSETTETNNPYTAAGSDMSGLLDAAVMPKITWRTRLYWRIRRLFKWKQCKGEHMPYKEWTDEQCRTSFECSNNANRKIYYCLRRRWHLGKHRDIHGRTW